jgi:RNA polymerase sigma-70 factor (ECF subfamily)
MRQPAPKPEFVSGVPPSARAVSPQLARDVELVTRIRAGDKRAEELLYRAHVQAVSALAARLLGRSHEAEDVVQEVFLTALARLYQLRDAGLFRAWLLRITVHEVHRCYRRRKLLRALGIGGAPDDASLAELAGPSLSAELRAELGAIDRVLARLPGRERVAWMLRHVEGYELTEIASACDASLATIKRWISRAEVQLHAHVALGASHD